MTHIFIVNPYAGQKNFAEDLRKKLAEIDNLNYFVFNTRCAGYESEIAKKVQHFFPDEQLRFYCCGGSGTMRNVLNGLEDLKKTEVAYFPCGLTNDFLKVFGEDQKRFFDIMELIHGDVIKLDYIKTNHGLALNTLSFGMDTDFNNKLKDWQLLGVISPALPYVLAMVHALLRTKPQKFKIRMDAIEREDAVTEFCWSNGHTLGGMLHMADSACVQDGKALCRYMKDLKGFRTIPPAKAFITNDQNRLDSDPKLESMYCQKLLIRRQDGKPFGLSFDGEMVYNIEECQAEIIRQGLQFVVPKGVTL